MTLLQELEFGRLMQTPMKDFPQEIKDDLIGRIICMETIRDAVERYVLKHEGYSVPV
jgi:hypothetical protein